MIEETFGENVRCVNLRRKRNTSAVERPSRQKKRWKRTRRRLTRNRNAFNYSASLPLLFYNFVHFSPILNIVLEGRKKFLGVGERGV